MDINKIRNKYLNFYSDCIPVQGSINAAIYDLTRQEIIKIPRVYFNIIEQARDTNIGELIDGIQNAKSKKNVIEFLRFLDENEFINFNIKPDKLLKLNPNLQSACFIQNAIIDINKIHHDFDQIIPKLSSLGCELIQLRYFSNKVTVSEILKVLKKTYHTSIQGVEIVVCFNPKYNHQDYVSLMENEPIISKLTVHTANANKVITTSFGEDKEKATLEKSINFLKNAIKSHDHCGIIHLQNINKPTSLLFLENKSFNGCLNKKISIDIDGMIRNCPSMSDSYGHYSDTDFASVLEISEFKEKWSIKKDDISVCKDCELRYACTDCRAYLTEPSNLLSKPLKCGYNPYKGQWSDWKNNAENAVAIKYYEQLVK